MLKVMGKNGDHLADIFNALFKNKPFQRIFRFLDEVSSLTNELAAFTTVPITPFMQAILKTGVLFGRYRLPEIKSYP